MGSVYEYVKIEICVTLNKVLCCYELKLMANYDYRNHMRLG